MFDDWAKPTLRERFMPPLTTLATSAKFLKLQGQTAFIDLNDYYIKELDKILGVLVSTSNP